VWFVMNDDYVCGVDMQLTAVVAVRLHRDRYNDV